MIDSSIIDKTADLFADGIGAGEPEGQIVAGLLIGAVIIATSAVGLVGTLLLLPIPIAMIALGVLRMIPAVDNYYPL